YALSLEQGTPLRSWVTSGLLPMPDSDLAAEMYLWASNILAEHGYQQYEISNWARTADEDDLGSCAFRLHPSAFIPAYACRHNLQYWRNQPYLGLGAGAHGCTAGWRYSNVLAPAAYIARLNTDAVSAQRAFPFSPGTVETTAITPETAMDE